MCQTQTLACVAGGWHSLVFQVNIHFSMFVKADSLVCGKQGSRKQQTFKSTLSQNVVFSF